jgi:hypothetical protein
MAEASSSSKRVASVFQALIDTLGQQYQEEATELFGETSSPLDAVQRVSPRFADLLRSTITSTNCYPKPASLSTEHFSLAWWRSVERRLESCERCIRQKVPGGACAEEPSLAIEHGMIPNWEPSVDTLIPIEQACDYWPRYIARQLIIEAGVPESLANENSREHPIESECLEKLRACFERGAVLGVIGQQRARNRLLVVMTTYLARQKKRKPFMVRVLDLEFRSKMADFAAHKTTSPLVELMAYKRCLFLFCHGHAMPDWLKKEIGELLVYRAMKVKPTVYLDETSDVVMMVKGFGEVLGCKV